MQGAAAGGDRELRRAACRGQLRQLTLPSRVGARLFLRDESQPQQRVVQLVGGVGLRARLLASRARSLRDRAGRCRRRSRDRASGGSPRPACGALRAAHRRERRTDARTGSRAQTARASSARAPSHAPRRSPDATSSRSSPSMSIASCRQSSMVWLTSGWSGISRSPAMFSWQASWSGKTAAIEVLGFHALQLRRDLVAAAEAQQRERDRCVPAPARHEHRRIEQRLHQQLAHARCELR